MENNNESYNEDLNNVEEDETSKNNEEQEEKDYQQLYENQKIRAEKAEKKAKELESKASTKEEAPAEKEETPKNDSNYSIKDFKAISDIPDEDLDDFLELSNKFGLSPSEAKANQDIQVLLKNRAEVRKTEAVMNTGGGKRGSSKVSDQVLLNNAKNGKLPESDDDIDRLINARLEDMSGQSS
jgi:hypothetical protein